jgi:hypothetical protein
MLEDSKHSIKQVSKCASDLQATSLIIDELLVSIPVGSISRKLILPGILNYWGSGDIHVTLKAFLKTLRKYEQGLWTGKMDSLQKVRKISGPSQHSL